MLYSVCYALEAKMINKAMTLKQKQVRISKTHQIIEDGSKVQL